MGNAAGKGESMSWLRYLLLSVVLLLSSCFKPPYNQFERHNYVLAPAAKGTALGAALGVVAGSTLIGTGIGATIGIASGLYKDSRPAIIEDLAKNDIVYYQYGDINLLIVPTDRYFLFNRAVLNDLCYHGLTDIVRLLKFYPRSTIYVAGFTDNIGSTRHKNKLSQARAEAMITYFWANGVNARRLHPEGYGDKHDVAPNSIIHGSAFNRRLEIEWMDVPFVRKPPRKFGYIK
jgi:outer membrane protein OmpA-like peptidoglycan-associated protein